VAEADMKMLTESCNSDHCHCPRCEAARGEGQYLRPRVYVAPSDNFDTAMVALVALIVWIAAIYWAVNS
jgi:hypothetical protein